MIGALHYHYLSLCYGHHFGINNCTGAYGLELSIPLQALGI